ncbi:MAG: hypothetical protein JW742_02805 [Candidatus Aminicenantes bacterium]|nr:hypothetical protein [Candidatus Aminicenantes bacterium]
MKTKAALATAALGLWLAGPAAAEKKFEASLRFTPGFPLGEFGDTLDTTGLGMDLGFAYRWPGTIVSTGASFGFLIMGSESRDEPLSATIPDLFVRVTTANSLLLGHLFVRLQPREGLLRPYAEGLAGFHYLFTTTSISETGSWGGTLSSTNLDDWAFSYGLGGGVKLALLRVRSEDSSETKTILDLDLGARWLKGGRADYLKKGSVHREDGVVTYDVYNSRTDLLQAGIGLTVSF